MSLTGREAWAVIHGMILGALFLLTFTGGLVALWATRPDWLTRAGVERLVGQLQIGTWVMAVIAWLTVITGTYIVYPWYRAPAPPGTTGPQLGDFPRAFLLADPRLAAWHTIGMEWKEHVAWMAPILATAVAAVVMTYGTRLADHPQLRQAVIVLFTLAFATAAIAGLFGAFITKAAPIH